MQRIHFRPVELLSQSILLSVAAFFRFFRLEELLVFQGDEARALLAAREILSGNLLLVGPETSVSGFHLGPFFYYLIAPVLWLAQYNPVGPAFLTAGFGVATVVVLYRYGKRFFSWETGLLLGILYALSPHAIWQSRIALEPSPVPFFSVCWLYSVTAWSQERKLPWLLLAALSIILGMQLNFSIIVLLPATLWLLLSELPVSGQKRAMLQVGSLGILAFALLFRAFWRPVTSWEYFLDIWAKLTLPSLPEIASLLLCLLLLATGLLLWRKRPVRTDTKVQIVTVWLVFSLAGFILKYVSGEHALALLFPAPVIFFGLLYFFAVPRYISRQIAIPVLGIVLLALTWQTWIFLQSKPGSDFAFQQKIAAHILELAEGKPYRFLYRGHLDIYDAIDDRYIFLLWRAGQPPVESYRREISAETLDHWELNSHQQQPEHTIVLYHPSFNFNEYSGFQDAEPWHELWFAVGKSGQ